MRFGPVPLAEARGAILAHTHRLAGRVLKKGMVLDEAAIAALAVDGRAEVIAAQLEPGDVPEDEAARRLAEALAAPHLAASRAATGRVNILAGTRGLLVLNRGLIDQLNSLDEGLTLATLPDHSVVEAKEMVGTIKVIPFSVPGQVLTIAELLLRGGGAIALHPFLPIKAGLVLSTLPGLKDSILDGTVEATSARIEALGGTLLPPATVRHDTAAIADGLARLLKQGAGLVMVAGASAVVDRRDVGPAAILRLGGQIEHFGMPVDPGNLLCLGCIGDVPALVLPGCARSPKLNGFDWVLQRLFAGRAVTGRDVMGMGVGGLLKEIETRPMPRAEAPKTPPPARTPRRPRRVAALVLAAGRSRRMAPLNKLLIADPSGTPMIARVVDHVLASHARPVIVVTGHQRERVEEALSARPVLFTHAEDYAEGLSASLKAGLAALPPDAEGVMVCLGDMPLVTAEMFDRLMAAFDPEEGRAIVLPTYRGKQGNPMIWAARFVPQMQAIGGDVGARHLLGANLDVAHEVEMTSDAVLRDFDTAESLKGA